MQQLNYSIPLTKKKTSKTLQSINKFNYYHQHLFPQLFPQQNNTHVNDFNLKSTTSQNNMTYLLGSYHTQELSGITPSLLLASLSKNYISNIESPYLLKIGHNYFKQTDVKNTFNYFNSSATASELLEFYIEAQTQEQNSYTFTQKNQDFDGNQKHKLLQSVKPSKIKKQKHTGSRKLSTNVQSSNFNIYIFHHCYISNKECSSSSSNTIQWQNFIQKYEVTSKQINYSLVCSYVSESSTLFSFGYFSNNFDNLMKSFLQQNYFSIDFVNKVIGTALQVKQSFKDVLNQIDDPAFSDEHRRVLRLPTQYYPTFSKLKKHFGSKSTENQICRFLVAKSFKYEQTLKSISEYHDWKEKMMKKYTMEDFKFFIEQNIFIYVGEDKKGRPIILNQACRVNIKNYDADLYSDFYIYWLQIYLPTKMRGYVDQIVILADVANLSMDNFKISVTKRNIVDSLNYSPQRQLKLFAINAGHTAYFCWRLIKPLIPVKTDGKIVVVSTDPKQLVQQISQDIDIDVIPTYLGGNNHLKELQKNLVDQIKNK